MYWYNPSILSLTILLILYAVLVVSSIVVVLSENRNPIKSMAWTIALIFLPVVGLVFYFVFGRSLKGMTMVSRRRKRKWMLNSRTKSGDVSLLNLTPDFKNLIRLGANINSSPFTLNNEITVFTDGARKFEALCRDLRDARQSILLQYYIFADDELGREIADLLIEKAREGVEVKVLYDHVGCFSTKNSFFRRMRDAGVDVHPFFKVTFPQLANRINWRNHRKIVVIDREIGYIGGMNIAKRYVEGIDATTHWRDTHFRLRGEIVESLFYSFMVDWNWLSRGVHPTPPPAPANPVSPNILGMQLITSGPADKVHNLTLCMLKAITCAKKSIFIQTPYFLPPPEILTALEAAALAKLDVRVMIPRSSDSRMLKFASFSYVTRCLTMGIKVYLYDPGMIHSKVIMIDDELVTAGSCNLDFRSLENNFECNFFAYDESFCKEMKEIFFKDMENCVRVNLTDWSRRPRLQRTMESLVRLVSPIL